MCAFCKPRCLPCFYWNSPLPQVYGGCLEPSFLATLWLADCWIWTKKNGHFFLIFQLRAKLWLSLGCILKSHVLKETFACNLPCPFLGIETSSGPWKSEGQGTLWNRTVWGSLGWRMKGILAKIKHTPSLNERAFDLWRRNLEYNLICTWTIWISPSTCKSFVSKTFVYKCKCVCVCEITSPLSHYPSNVGQRLYLKERLFRWLIVRGHAEMYGGRQSQT